MVTKASFLTGMKEITNYLGFSEMTVLKHKQLHPYMPIRKEGGIWIGDPERLDAFYRDLAAGKAQK